ncbi:hypothetical protein PsorP6_002786 [Peronosclerospora sorghi]|uniref:Uncharacterized protein n=1 Tax=Peronosclerospora sorghi TaxID=230839 RepID=A0ACC0VQ05_9STRA|nr:hypothetical protein PsorP6_002786 [Peronosclerospora sorghi]
MSRSKTVSRSRNGRAGAYGPVASKSETLVLRVTPSIKRYNIARFDLPELPHLSSCAQPSSTYMLLVKNRHNDEFSVMLVEQWFRLKKPLSYRTDTLEEAEEMNNKKKQAVERWLMKHKLEGEDKADASGETVSAPRVRTGALAISSSKTKTENDDIFGVANTARPRRVPRPKDRGEGATGEDGGDFEEKFDDDEVTRKFIMTNHEDLSPIRTKTSLKWILKELAIKSRRVKP